MQTTEKVSEYSNRVAEVKRLRIQGHFAKAQTLLDSVLSSSPSHLELNDLYQLKYERGCLFLDQGNYNEANRVFEELFSEDTAGTAISAGLGLNGLGLCALAKGYHQEALAFFRRALASFELTDYREGVVKALGNLSECLLELGEVSQATNYLEKALKLSKENFHAYGIAWSLAGLGILLAAKNQLEESRRVFIEALNLFEELSIERVWVLCEAAEVFIASGELQFAENLLQRANNMARNSSTGELAQVQLQWGMLEFERGNLGLASHHFQSALSRTNAVRVRARVYLQLARVHLSKYRSSELRDYAIDEIEYYVDQALKLAEKPTPIIPLMIEISLVKAGIAEAQLNFEKAIRILQEARELSQGAEIPILSRKLHIHLEKVMQKKIKFLRLMKEAENDDSLISEEITRDDAKSYLEEILRIVDRRSI